MNRIPVPLLAGLSFAMAAFASVAPVKDTGKNSRAHFALWGTVSNPLAGEHRPIGTYAAGCLAGAEALPLDGPGYSVMRPSRKRYFGYPDLVSYIKDLGRKLKAEKLPLLLVGDMGRPRGGPMPTGHSSHQIGLDVDLWFRMSRRRPTGHERESWSAVSMVKGDRELTPSWSGRTRKLAALAAASPNVNRIFVHPAIKRDLCARFKDEPWLYKFRAWWAHHDHLHVRLNCPEGAKTCQPQAPLDPKDTQCGTGLDWWFSADAKEEGKKKDAAFAERAFPDLPEECGRMVAVPTRAEAN
jgi:penicillin-insensitive murein endopeptidase